MVLVEISVNGGGGDVFEELNRGVEKVEEIEECDLVCGDLE